MRKHILGVILGVLFIVGINCFASAGTFPVFDALLYRERPDLVRDFGWSRVQMVYAPSLWPKGTKNEDMNDPSETIVRRLARTLRTDSIVCVDIEQWPVMKNGKMAPESIRKYIQVLDWMHEEKPKLRIGYYGVLPIRDYWVPNRYTKADADYAAWQAGNRALRKLADHTDVIFPSLYTFYDDPKGWEKYAVANMEEARIYHKPVYPFLWPEYHDSNKSLSGKELPPDLWRRELEISRQYADGIVVWGGYKKDWREDALWWQETKRFMLKQTAS